MNWFQKLFSKAAQQNFQFLSEWRRWNWMPITFSKLIDEGYRVNSAVSACTTALAFSFPEPQLLPGYETDGKFIADYNHPALTLIRQPNADMGEAELMQFAVTYAAVGGNLYLWKQRAQNGKVVALWPFNDAQIQPVPGHNTAEGFVSGYEYDSGDGMKIALPKDDIIHWKWMPDPTQPWRGIGAIEFAARDVDKDNEASAYIYSLLKNNAVPPIIITLAEGDELTKVKAKRLRKEWKQVYGDNNAGGPGFLEAGMKAEKLGFDLQQLAAETLNAVPESRIAAAFRVPPVVAGLSVGLKRSDYGDAAARRAFAEQTLTALWRSLASEITNGLADEFPGTGRSGATSLQFRFDLKQVLALRDDENKIWERANNAFDRGMLTRAEAKLIVGLDPGPGDEVYKLSLANEFVPAAGAKLASAGGREWKGRHPQGMLHQEKATASGRQLQRIRKDVARRMEKSVDVYFTQLGNRVVERATGDGKGRKSDLPNADDLLTGADEADLARIIKRFFIEIIELSWNAWNASLGLEIAFDLEDPLVTKILAMAALRVGDIQATTLEEIRQVLQYGSENGWGIDELVRGDPENGIPGLRDLVQETYKGRAETIARTELGEAQNAATADRYKRAGVELVEILDDGLGDDDEPCITANGQIWTLEIFAQNFLEHPNCTRAAAPYFGDATPDRS